MSSSEDIGIGDGESDDMVIGDEEPDDMVIGDKEPEEEISMGEFDAEEMYTVLGI